MLYSAEVREVVGGEIYTLSSGQVILNMHMETQCLGEHCPLHNPSNHPLKDLPLYFNGKHMIRILGTSEESQAFLDTHKEYEASAFLVDTPGDSSFESEQVVITIDPDDYLYNISGVAILRNSGHCTTCKTNIESKHVHDAEFCVCGESMVDGGLEYLRRTANPSFTDTSIVVEKEIAE